jgi:RNA polymerase sigma-32 factor
LNAYDKCSELDAYFRDVRRFTPLRRDAENQLGRRSRKGDVAATHRLINANLRFVVKIAGEYRSTGLPIADLVQEGNLGLMKAVSKFDPDRGLRLISYAVWWIRAYIRAYILRSWSLVRIGTTQAERRLFFALGKEYRYFRDSSSDGDAVDVEVLAKRLMVKPCKVIDMRTRIAARDRSMDAPLFHESDVSLMDVLPGNAEEIPEYMVGMQEEARLRGRQLRVALSRLRPRERFILERRTSDDQPATLQSIACELKVSAERVRQLEIRARLKVRASMEAFASTMDAAA